ncbi:uncharacterized protein LOC111902139 [Lactuca sativa]|uniref:uncharacterized protein LOC111902139 n=1 Tax=Lactuca sativa TaxID=4236 RepID=UPI000CD84964|nr:uncharacterized protein LOC111902139 [Lactuca sativa]
MARVAFRLDLPDEISQIHNTFHVSRLRKCVVDDSAVISMDDIQVDECLNYMERPILILNRKAKTLCNKVVNLVKVKWQRQKGSEWTWQPEDEMMEHYSDLFVSAGFEDEV